MRSEDTMSEFKQSTGATLEVLPEQVSTEIEKAGARVAGRSASKNENGPKIWIDLDNTPHVPFFEPIIEQLEARGYPVLLTARDAFQVCELAERKGMRAKRVGRHWGKNPFMKAAGLGIRTLQLLGLVAKERPVLGVSHGARSQLLLANLVGMRTLLLDDYEHCHYPRLLRPTQEMVPEAIGKERLAGSEHARSFYPGIKEDVYAWKLSPDAALLKELKLDPSSIIATVRPPATEAHYHNPESELLFERFMDRACKHSEVRVVLLPRNQRQAEMIQDQWPEWFDQGKTIIPERAVDGMNLIWHSDLVVSGGGTMNREAAALGVPVYSIFRGQMGGVDRHLVKEGRLTMIESEGDADELIRLEKREPGSLLDSTSQSSLEAVVDAIAAAADAASAAKPH